MQVLQRLPAKVDESGQFRELRVAFGFVEYGRIAVEAEEHRFERLQSVSGARLRLTTQSTPQCRIVAVPAEESEIVATQSRSDFSRHHCRLDQQGTGAAQRIDQSAARGVHDRPTCAQQHRRCEIFLQRRLSRALAVAALVQRRTGQIDAQRRTFALEQQVNAQRRSFGFHIGTFSTFIAKLIDDSVLDPQRRVLTVGDPVRGTDGIDGKARFHIQMRTPVDGQRTGIQGIAIHHRKLCNWHQDAAGQARPQAGAITGVEFATKMHAGQRLMHVGHAERFQLVDQKVFQALWAGCEKVAHQVNRPRNWQNCPAIKSTCALKR